jgi:hypothetical protein
MEKVNKSELCETAYKAMEALYSQWGDIRTPFGYVWKVKLAYGWSNYPSDKGITIEWSNGYYSGDSTNGIMRLVEQTLPAMANYLASEDFVKKVAGSIRRLKAITRAMMSSHFP